jgi:PAS domain S-box-containing protein
MERRRLGGVGPVSTVGSVPRLAGGVVALALAVGLFASLWRRRSAPTAHTLSWLGATVVCAALTHLALADLLVLAGVVPAGPAGASDAWVVAVYDLTTVAMGLWFAFVVDYTGRGALAATVARVAAAALATTASVATVAVVVGPGGRTPLVDAVFGTVGSLAVGLTVVGVFLLVGEATRETAIPRRGAAALATGALALSVTPVTAATFLEPLTVPVTLGVASAALWVAVARYPTFESLPAARVAGRDAVLDSVADAVVVLDDDGAVVDCNAAAERVFDVDREAVRGASPSALSPSLPAPATVRERDAPARVETADGVDLAVTADRVADARGRRVGWVLVCRDVTDRRDRERRVSLLTRLLADVVRDEAAAVADAAGPLADGEGDPATVGRGVQRRTAALRDLVGAVRAVEQALEDSGAGAPADAGAVAASVLGGADHLERPDDPVRTGLSPSVLEPVLSAVVAAGHDDDPPAGRSDDRAETRVSVTAGPPTVRVDPPTPVDDAHPSVRLARVVLAPDGSVSVEEGVVALVLPAGEATARPPSTLDRPGAAADPRGERR